MKKTRFVLLGLLQEEDLSGYEIKKIIDLRMSFFWQESFGQIYPELNKMLKEGLIELTNNETKEKVKHDKVKYQITEKGIQELKQWMEKENEKDTVRSEFLLKMYLSTSQNMEEMNKHLLTFKMESEQKLELFRLFHQQISKDIDLHNNHRQILNVLNLGIRQAELYISWSNELLKESVEKEY